MRISIHDVAERAGVSPGTVSHTLNGNDAARIAPATRERVRRAAAELGYRPNSAARSLGRGKTGAIGLLLGGLKNPFFVEALETMERLALAAGYRVLLEASPSEHGTYSGYAAPPEYWPVDGVIAWSHSPDEARAQLGAPYAYLPLISIGGRAGAEAASFDYAQGGRLAAERLLTRGRGRLAYVSPYAFGEDRHEEPRHIGFAERCAAAGVRGRYLLTNAEETRAAGLQVAERIAALPPSERPDGLFCHNDLLAMGVCCGLRRAGITPGQEIAVIGHDGIEEGLYLESPLTTIVLPVENLCRVALDSLIFCLNHASGDKKGGENLELLPVTLRDGGTA